MKSLNLNREKCHSLIDGLKDTFQIEKTQKSENLISYKFIVTGEQPALLNIYENIDGTTTLQHKTGKNQDLSLKIAEKIVAECSIKEFRATSFYVKSIRDEDFNTIIEFLVENQNVIEQDNEDERGKRQITIRGKQGDKIVITKHSNNSFQVQGKPKLLFQEIIEILSDLMPFKDVIEQQLAFYEIELTSADIIGELQTRLPNSFDKLEDKLKTIIVPSLALSKMHIELDDYSAYAYPCLRGLEGIIKQIFINQGVTVFGREGFGTYFVKIKGKYVASDTLNDAISDIGVRDKLCKLYKYYNRHRHGLFHIDDIIVTSKIISLEEANNIITKTLELIDDCADHL